MRAAAALAAAVLILAGVARAQDPENSLAAQLEEEARKRPAAGRGLPMPPGAAPFVVLEWRAWELYLADLALEATNRRETLRLEGFLRALRLFADDVGLEETIQSLPRAESIVVYDFAHDRYVISAGTAGMRWRALQAFVHEAVHQLEEAHLGIAFDRRLAALEGEDDASLAFRSLVEGTATFATAATLYMDHEVPFDRMPDLAAAVRTNAARMEPTGTGPWLREALVAPYADGAAFVHALLRRMSWAEFDARVYPDPPASMEQILHPEKYLAGEKPVRVTLPEGLDEAVGPAWRPIGESTAGELTLRVLVGPDAAAGWGGDRYRVYRDEAGRTIAVWTIEFDREDDALEFARAFPLDVARERTIRERRRSVVIADPKKALSTEQFSAILSLLD